MKCWFHDDNEEDCQKYSGTDCCQKAKVCEHDVGILSWCMLCESKRIAKQHPFDEPVI